MVTKGFIRKYLISSLLILFGCIIELLTFNKLGAPLWLIGLMIIVLGFLQSADKIYSDNDFKNKFTELNTTMKGMGDEFIKNKTTLDSLKKTSEEQATYYKDLVNKISDQQKVKMNLVAKLLDQGLINPSDVVKHLEGTDLFILYCYAYPVPLPLYTPLKEKLTNRLYISFLQEIGFVRLPHTTVFIITANRLTKKLRTSESLRNWILGRLKEKLEEEANIQLSKLNKKRRDIVNEKYGIGKYSNAFNLNVLIFRTKLNQGNIGIINKTIWPDSIMELLGSDVKTDEIKIEEAKKIEVRKFVFESSFELFFSDVPHDDLKKLRKLEPILKEKLNINNFLNYTERSVDDIKNVFEQSLDPEKAILYSSLLKSRVTEYGQALKEMGISTV